MGAQLSLKAAMPLAETLATCRKNVSNTGPCILLLKQAGGYGLFGFEFWPAGQLFKGNVMHVYKKQNQSPSSLENLLVLVTAAHVRKNDST